MKKVLTILSAVLFVTGLKAQKANVQKETVKPKADTLLKNSANKSISKPVEHKDAKIAPALKYQPLDKVAPESKKLQKQAATQQ
ncbi:MAG: hypothetical protein QM726_08925 [Chitinophagaceae bacterium]